MEEEKKELLEAEISDNEVKEATEDQTADQTADQTTDQTADQTTDQTADQTAEIEKEFCVKCGTEIVPGNVFCPKCGHKVGEKLVADSTALQAGIASQPKKSSKKVVGIIIGIVAILAAIVVIVLVLRGVQAKDITLNKKNASVKVDEIVNLSYTINPADTKDKTVTWTSSNESIAQVNGGTITGINEGECTITVSTINGKTDVCTITVLPAGPDLQALYNEYCSYSFANVAGDGSYLSIDTNPNDKDDYFDYEAYQAIVNINEALELPESVLNKMNQTRSMDGIQSYSTDELEITWTYHPDKGMEVNYTLK